MATTKALIQLGSFELDSYISWIHTSESLTLEHFEKSELLLRSVHDNFASEFNNCLDKTCDKCIKVTIPSLIETQRVRAEIKLKFCLKCDKAQDTFHHFKDGLTLLSSSLEWAQYWKTTQGAKKEDHSIFEPLRKMFSKSCRVSDSRNNMFEIKTHIKNWREATIWNLIVFMSVNNVVTYKGSDSKRFNILGKLLCSQLIDSALKELLLDAFEPLSDLCLEFIDREVEFVASFLTQSGFKHGLKLLPTLTQHVHSLEKISPVSVSSLRQTMVKDLTLKFNSLKFLDFTKKLRQDNQDLSEVSVQNLISYAETAEILLAPFCREYPDIWIDILLEVGRGHLDLPDDADSALAKFRQAEEFLPNVRGSSWKDLVHGYIEKAIQKKIEQLSKKIMAKRSQGVYEMINYVLTEFPPIHIPDFNLSKWRKFNIQKSRCSKMNFKMIKSVFCLYHTDKVSGSRHGQEYFKMIEEITKLFGGELAKFKY